MEVYWGMEVLLHAFLTSALDGGEWSASRLGYLTPTERVPYNQELGGPHSRSGKGGEKKNSQPLPGLEPPIIQPIAQLFTPEICRLLMNDCCYRFTLHIKFVVDAV
jgi:hypothetical protein